MTPEQKLGPANNCGADWQARSHKQTSPPALSHARTSPAIWNKVSPAWTSYARQVLGLLTTTPAGRAEGVNAHFNWQAGIDLVGICAAHRHKCHSVSRVCHSGTRTAAAGVFVEGRQEHALAGLQHRARLGVVIQRLRRLRVRFR